MKKEAFFYEKYSEDSVRCLLCHHKCVIAEGSAGICKVRKNRGGVLYSLNYGKPVALSLDPIEKKPLYHFLPATASFSIASYGCNFKCLFCQNWSISQYGGSGLEKIGYIPPEAVVAEAVASGASSIAYTYTEPTVFFEYAVDIAVLAGENGLKNVFISNGFFDVSALGESLFLFDAFNIDIKSGEGEFYKKYCSASIFPVLENVEFLVKNGMWVEVTTLLINSLNTSDKSLKKIAGFLSSLSGDIPWHISGFWPNYKMQHIEPTEKHYFERAYAIGKDSGINYIYYGNIPGKSDTVCRNCGKIIVKRTGYSITEINIANGKCTYCGEKIPGIF